MVKYKSKLNTRNDLTLHIALHPKSETSFNKDIDNIHKIMRDHFGDSQEKVFESLFGTEVIYRVQKPVLLSDDEMRDFFQTLRKVFTLSAIFNPHFTQFQESGKQ